MKRRDLITRSLTGLGTVSLTQLTYARPCPPTLLGGSSGSPECLNETQLPLGALTQEARTPEQIALYLPITGTMDDDSYATVRYRLAAGSVWRRAHPLLRIRPEWTARGAPEEVVPAFAGTIFDLLPGESYRVEVLVVDPRRGQQTFEQEFSTKALPAVAGAATVSLSPGDDVQSAVNALTPGDVLELQPGNYSLPDNLVFRVSGTAAAPIYIRGVDRDDCVLVRGSGRILDFAASQHLVIENLTCKGSGFDGGPRLSSASIGARFSGDHDQSQLTIRNVRFDGVDRGVMVGQGHGVEGILVYDCIFEGNNRWDQDIYGESSGNPADGILDIEQSSFWNDDCLRLAGVGNCAFNNTIDGFGDSCSVEDRVHSAAVYFYRNTITNSGDDACEGDYGTRNMGLYDNHITNCRNLFSGDPIWGGPFYIFRNVAINTMRGPFKLNATNSGLLIYHNTIIRTDGYPLAGTGFLQNNNGAQRNWAFRNNLLVYRSSSPNRTLFFQPSEVEPVDFSNNGWYPDRKFVWVRDSGNTLAEAKARVRETAPAFPIAAGLSSSNRRHANDQISEREPFSANIILGSDHRQAVEQHFEPTLRSSSRLKHAGVALPGINDGYAGPSPDIGALIEGIGVPVRGHRD